MPPEAPDNVSRPLSPPEAMRAAADAFQANGNGSRNGSQQRLPPKYPNLVPNMADSLEEQRIRLEKEKEFAVKMNDSEWMIKRSKRDIQMAEKELEFAEKEHAFRRIERELDAERLAHAARETTLTETKILLKHVMSKNHDLQKEVQDLNQKLLECQQENVELRNELEDADNLDERVDMGLEQLQQQYPHWQQSQ